MDLDLHLNHDEEISRRTSALGVFSSYLLGPLQDACGTRKFHHDEKKKSLLYQTIECERSVEAHNRLIVFIMAKAQMSPIRADVTSERSHIHRATADILPKLALVLVPSDAVNINYAGQQLTITIYRIPHSSQRDRGTNDGREESAASPIK